MKKVLIVTLCVTLEMISCNKEKDQNNQCPVEMSRIAGSYKLTAMKYKTAISSPEADLLYTLEACMRDDIFQFNADGTYNYLDRGTVCDPTGSNAGLWSLNGNRLTVNGETATIIDFNCSTLVVSKEDIFTAGDKMTLTYHKQ